MDFGAALKMQKIDIDFETSQDQRKIQDFHIYNTYLRNETLKHI